MSNITTPFPSPSDTEQETILSQLFEEIQRLNERMQSDQADIERLKLETRVLSRHSDQILLQIEAQVAALRKAA